MLRPGSAELGCWRVEQRADDYSGAAKTVKRDKTSKLDSFEDGQPAGLVYAQETKLPALRRRRSTDEGQPFDR